jgi:mono/diheme cytochrome c family protein
MRIKFVVTAVIGCVVLFGSPASASSPVVEQGKTLYENRCLHCHGVNADGQGELIEHLNVKPANIVGLCMGRPDSCMTDRVLKAVLGRHEVGSKKMPLLKDYISVEDVYALSEYLKTRR